MRNPQRHLLLLVFAASLLVSCGSQEDSWTPVAEDALDAPRKQQRKAAFEAKDALFSELSGRLMEAMGEGGPAGAIEVCRSEAEQIAQRVSKERGLTIGRTSFRLRNPLNAPPEWAKPYVETRTADNVYVQHADGRLGVLLPIRLQNPCVGCHGARENFGEDVRQKLTQLYPDDEAVGFAAGDLRGWFWLEVPPAEAADRD